MSDRILNIVNGILVLACLACIYYLVTAKYEKPSELAEATDLLVEDTSFKPIVDETLTGRPALPAYAYLNKEIMQPLFTPTPTPTPPPPPPPSPPNLGMATESWQISSIIDENTVEFTDAQTQESFTMTLNGPARIGKDKENRDVPVTVSKIDMNELKVTLKFADQQIVKSF